MNWVGVRRYCAQSEFPEHHDPVAVGAGFIVAHTPEVGRFGKALLVDEYRLACEARAGAERHDMFFQPDFALAHFADLERNPRVQVQAIEERQYYEDQSGTVAGQLLGLAGFVAVVMGIGAVFGAMNTMYALVAARTREIGTLRALGFSRRSILTTFVLESTFLAMVGGALGCLIALPANGITSAAGGPNFAEVAFAFWISGVSLAIGMALAVMMGIAGGVLPAFRASRLPITSALRGV